MHGGRERRRGPTASSTAPRDTNVDGAESRAEDALTRSTARGAGNVARAAAAAGAWTIHVSSDYVFDGIEDASPTSSPTRSPRCRSYGRSKLAGELAVADAAPDRHTIVRSSWLFGPPAPCFPATILRLASERDELTVVDDQIGCPTFTGHLAGALRLAGARARPGRACTSPPRGQCSWFEFAREIVAPARRLACDVKPGEDRRSRAARAAAGLQRAAEPSAAEAPRLPDWREGLAEYMSTYGDRGDEAARLRRRRLHRLDVRAAAGARARRRRRRCSTSSPTRGGGEPPRRDRSESASCTARSRTRPRSRDAVGDAARRSSTSPPRRTSTARSPGPRRSSSPTCRARTCCSRPRASAGCATCRSRPTRSTGRSNQGSFTEESPLAAVIAVQRDQDRRRPARRRATSTPTGSRRVICRGSNNYGPYQYPEKLIPLMILNALAGDRLPVYGDGRNVRNWLYVEDFGRGIGHVLAHGAPGETYNCGGPDECENIEVVTRILCADRRGRVADRVRHRPARPRPPLLAVVREAAGARMGAAGALRRGARADGRLVPRQRLVVGADPLRLPTASTTSATTGAR